MFNKKKRNDISTLPIFDAFWHTFKGMTLSNFSYVKIFTFSHFFHKFSTIYSLFIMSLSYSHTPILLHECAEYLKIKNISRHIDATLGLGGHAEYFLQINHNLSLWGIDQDPYAQEQAKKRLEIFGDRFQLLASNFEKIKTLTSFSPQSILFDIGVSSLQFDMPERGFSFRFKAPLDMRMNPNDSLTAEIIVNTYSEADLCKIFHMYGEEPDAKLIARTIVAQRKIAPFKTTTELSECITSVKPYFFARGKNGGGHPASLCFQALRIAVNREIEVLEKALHDAIEILEPKGRIAVITFHSLEDRVVKHIFASYARKEKKQKYASVIQENPTEDIVLDILTKKPIPPSHDEIIANPRSRSAKLRVVEKQ